MMSQMKEKIQIKENGIYEKVAVTYVTNSGEGEGLLFYGNVILPFVDRFPTDLELYKIMTTKLSEVLDEQEE